MYNYLWFSTVTNFMRYEMSHKCSEGNTEFDFYKVYHITKKSIVFFYLVTLIKLINFPPFYLQMMLEKRTNQGMLRLPKDEDDVSSSEKPTVKEKAEKGPVAVNGNVDIVHEGKTQHEKNDETKPKPGPLNVSALSAVEKTNPLSSPGLGKLTYNPITHAPSTFEFMCTDVSTQNHTAKVFKVWVWTFTI